MFKVVFLVCFCVTFLGESETAVYMSTFSLVQLKKQEMVKIFTEAKYAPGNVDTVWYSMFCWEHVPEDKKTTMQVHRYERCSKEVAGTATPPCSLRYVSVVGGS